MSEHKQVIAINCIGCGLRYSLPTKVVSPSGEFKRLWIIHVPGTAAYQVCKDAQELSEPYMSVAEHDAETLALRTEVDRLREEKEKYRGALQTIAELGTGKGGCAGVTTSKLRQIASNALREPCPACTRGEYPHRNCVLR